MKKYKKLQILKHALQHYVKRSDASQKDLVTENKLLDEITNEAEQLKEQYGINQKESV